MFGLVVRKRFFLAVCAGPSGWKPGSVSLETQFRAHTGDDIQSASIVDCRELIVSPYRLWWQPVAGRFGIGVQPVESDLMEFRFLLLACFQPTQCSDRQGSVNRF